MCVEISNKMENTTSNKKISYSMKKLLKQIFKQNKSAKLADLQNYENEQKVDSMASLESLENSRNASLEEDDSSSLESYENDINERLSSKVIQYVPVHFVRNECGTFFWTGSSELISCLQDRWAQA